MLKVEKITYGTKQKEIFKRNFPPGKTGRVCRRYRPQRKRKIHTSEKYLQNADAKIRGHSSGWKEPGQNVQPADGGAAGSGRPGK